MHINTFSILYLILSSAFIVIGIQKHFWELLYLGLFTLIIAVLSSLSWWHNLILVRSKNDIVFICFMLTSLVLIQCYGLISRHFGFSPILIGSFIVSLIGVVERIYYTHRA